MKDLTIPGLLIEYLVVGCSALLWLTPLVDTSGELVRKLSVETAVLLFPMVYVLGMLIDYVGYLLVSRPERWNLKRWARRGVLEKADIAPYLSRLPKDGEGRANRAHIFLAQDYPALLQELGHRSSRDRIARCSIINFSLLAAVLAYDAKGDALHVVLASLAAVIAFLAWSRYESQTHAFELRALLSNGYDVRRDAETAP
jgi:hypothetical protein